MKKIVPTKLFIFLYTLVIIVLTLMISIFITTKFNGFKNLTDPNFKKTIEYVEPTEWICMDKTPHKFKLDSKRTIYPNKDSNLKISSYDIKIYICSKCNYFKFLEVR